MDSEMDQTPSMSANVPDDHSDHQPSNSPSPSMQSDHKPIITTTDQLQSPADHPTIASLTCKTCPGGRTFASLEELNVHCTSTHRERPQYMCNDCGQTFSVKRELATHARIHSGEQPHQCGQCGKEFGTRQLLKKHTMWHTGERSHVCPHCAKAFFQKGHLTQHLMIHTGGRPHQCDLCDKTFIFKFDLNRHLKIHKERGFVCKQCGSRFGGQQELDEHRREAKCARSQERKSAIRRGPYDSPKIASIKNLIDGPKTEDQTISGSSKPATPKNDQNGMLLNSGTDQNMFDQQQQQLAIGRAFAQMLMVHQQQQQQHPKMEGQLDQSQLQQSQQYYPCLLCPQKFANQAAYLLHWSCAHNPSVNNNMTEESRVLGQLIAYQQQQQQQQLLLNLIKDNNRSEEAPCVASPLKVSPPIPSASASSSSSSSASSMDEHCSSASALPSASSQYSPNFFPSNACCPNCDLERRERVQCARELAEARAETDRLLALLIRFGTLFGMLNNNGANGIGAGSLTETPVPFPLGLHGSRG